MARNDQAVARAQAVHTALAGSLPAPIESELGTLVFDQPPGLVYDRAGNVVGVDAWVRLFRNGAEVPIDPHRRIINPPTIHEGVVDPAAAWRAAVLDSVRTAPASSGWRTRGTVDTIFATAPVGNGTASGSSATYATARTTFNSATNNHVVGQLKSGATFFCWESLLQFDTSPIADGDTVSDVVLSMFGSSDASTTDCVVTAAVSAAYNGGTVVSGDWISGASLGALTVLATWNTSGYAAAYNDFTSAGAAFNAAINKTGSTFLILFSDRHAAGTAPTDFEEVTFLDADAAGTTNDPKLVITHAAPAFSATATLTLPPLTAAATGRQQQAATASLTLPHLTSSAAGKQTQAATAAITLPRLTASATGREEPKATASLTLPRLAASASGKQTQRGTAAITLPHLTASATGVEEPKATASLTLPRLTAAATGRQTMAASATVTLPMLTASASGSMAVNPSGTSAVTLPMLTAAASGTEEPSGTASITLPRLTAAASGKQTMAGSSALTLPRLTASATGKQTQAATVAVSLPALRASATGRESQLGTSAISLPALRASMTGRQEQAATAAVTMPRLVVAASGLQRLSGTAVAVLPALRAAANGALRPQGTGTITLPPLSAAASGFVPVRGTAAITLPLFVVTVAGTLVEPVPAIVRIHDRAAFTVDASDRSLFTAMVSDASPFAVIADDAPTAVATVRDRAAFTVTLKDRRRNG